MNFVITSEVLQAYSLCPRKAYLLIYGKERGTLHEYEQILIRNQLINQAKNLEIFKQKYIDVHPYSISNFQKGYKVLTDANLTTDKYKAHCSILIKVEEFVYKPVIFIGTHTINNTDKLKLMFVGYLLKKIHNITPEFGHIINIKSESRRLNLEKSNKLLTPLLEPLEEWLNSCSPAEPQVILNKHCSICQFSKQCKEKAIQEDNLSLLDKVTPKIVRQYEKKGIFTIKQLSYLFKPRKRKKRARKPSSVTHDFKLQALAIRTGKIYLQEIPSLKREETELYLDIEGLPDQSLYYLIGVLIKQGEKTRYYSFWADDIESEEKIWQEFLAISTQYLTAPIYHYGSYELRAIKTLDKRYKTDSQSLISRLFNVNKQIYGKIYFPLYSNRLKEIAGFLGAVWTEANASGIKSLVWRHSWNDTYDSQYKSKLITYNQEDCYALELLVDAIEKIKDYSDVLSDVDFAQIPKSQMSKIGEKVNNQLEMILKFANVKYDKKKISFSQGKILEGRKRGGANPPKPRPKANKIIQVPHASFCLECGYSPLQLLETNTTRIIIDLVLVKNAIKKTITKYIGFYAYCKKCKRKRSPFKLLEFEANQFYGHGFKSWVIYHRVALRVPIDKILELAKEQFNEQMSPTRIPSFLQHFAKYYAETEEGIINRLLESPFIHVDETDFNIKGVNWYVWVFTNGKEVLLKLTETRENTIVHQVLEKYKGVLISDFYSGYDSVSCQQQKCWVHLIRNLNKDLRENPFDLDYEYFISEVRSLIVTIMETVQKYGLKKFHLQKFEKQVDIFYKNSIENKQYKSELTLRYQKHFKKYRDSLFYFLRQDGIPWHNNTAENAIRHVAIQRSISKTAFQETPTRNYLVMLSIFQTCRYQNKSFFKFLFSGETDLDNFKPRNRRQNK
ncbi:MAG: TM0106 family RecB-like putative nuclease [Prochloraceae cyanobacterium]|nr:TM0106 family RecB-like putative nuclease [Prochloraceae cyanobacterium]